MPDRIGSGAENVQSFLQPNNPGHTYAFQMNQPWALAAELANFIIPS
jgi:hypothetical protein